MGGIFLIQNDGQLVEMTEQSYDSEKILQTLIANYPNLLAGDQINSTSPRKWLLISREMPISSEEDGAGRWFIDHFFLDQDAIPTIVEVKRSSDTRIRREVIGQILDYAANAVVYLPVENIRSRFEVNHTTDNHSPEKSLIELLGEEPNVEEFWQKVKVNLQAGKVRLVFVADVIPDELRRVVEFLNSQMDPAEVIAVEIRQYIGKDMKTLIPRVLGLTSEAQQKKSKGSIAGDVKQWTEETFFQTVRKEKNATLVENVTEEIYKWSTSNNLVITWNKAKTFGGFKVEVPHSNKVYGLMLVYTVGIELQLTRLKLQDPFNNIVLREELIKRLNAIPGVNYQSDVTEKSPWLGWSKFTDPNALNMFLQTLDWIVTQIKST